MITDPMLMLKMTITGAAILGITWPINICNFEQPIASEA